MSDDTFWNKLGSFIDVRNQESPEELIEEVISEGQIVFVSGMEASAKSFIAQSWSAAVATGTPWNGQETRQGRVVYIIAEDTPQAILKRFDAWSIANGRPIQYDEQLRFIYGFSFSNKPLVRAILEGVATDNIALVVVDTLAASAGGLNLKEQSDVSVIQEFAEGIKRRSSLKTSVVIVAHSTKADGEDISGSIQLRGMADRRFSMTKRDRRYDLKCHKNKHGREDYQASFVIKETPIPEGEAIGVLTPTEDSALEDSNAIRFLEAWNDLEPGEWLSNFSAMERIKGQGISNGTAYRWRSQLLDSGILVSDGISRKRRLAIAKDLERLAPEQLMNNAGILASPSIPSLPSVDERTSWSPSKPKSLVADLWTQGENHG